MDLRPLLPSGLNDDVQGVRRDQQQGRLQSRHRSPRDIERTNEGDPSTSSTTHTQVPQLDFSAAFRHHVPPPPPPPVRLPQGVSNPFTARQHPNSFPIRRPASHRATTHNTPTLDMPAQRRPLTARPQRPATDTAGARRPLTARPQRPTTAWAGARTRSRPPGGGKLDATSHLVATGAGVQEAEDELPTQRQLSRPTISRSGKEGTGDRETFVRTRPQIACYEGETGSPLTVTEECGAEGRLRGHSGRDRGIRWSTFLRDKRYTSRPISKVETSGSLVPPGVHPKVLQEHLGESEMQIHRALNRDVVLSEEQMHSQIEIEKLKDAIVKRKPMPLAQSNRPISPG